MDVEKFLYKATGGSVSAWRPFGGKCNDTWSAKTLDDLVKQSGRKSDLSGLCKRYPEILAYKRTQHKDIMSELNVQFIMLESTIQIKDRVSK